jgi:hypothetical protein
MAKAGVGGGAKAGVKKYQDKVTGKWHTMADLTRLRDQRRAKMRKNK